MFCLFTKTSFSESFVSKLLTSSCFVNSDKSSFKPLNRYTQLRYFENDFPEEYLTILESRPTDFLMPSFHYNIALSLYQQGQMSTVKYWIDNAVKWESETVKKIKILQGKL